MKKNEQKEKQYAAYVLATYLANECYQRDKQSGKSADRSYDGTIKQHTLASVLAEKASVTQHRLTPVGYLKAVVLLFKIAFFRKKMDGTAPVFRSVFIIQ